MKNQPVVPNESLTSRNFHEHCPIDPLKETCEKFFQIWSHKAANISNELIEYTIRRLQSDRLRFLFQTRQELTHQQLCKPICQILTHTEDDMRRMKEQIRRFCLMTRNVYRHLRSDSRLYPKMCIDLDQVITTKMCRFIFKTKVLIKVFAKGQHLTDQQREKKTENEFKDPYRNLIKAFIVLQSNFEILFGDVIDRDFFENARTAVQTLPIILDVSKTIRLIFCALYKMCEPERQAEAEAIRQRRLALCGRGCGSMKNDSKSKMKSMNNFSETKAAMKELFKINQSQITQTSTTPPTDIQKPKTVKNSPKVASPSPEAASPNSKNSKASPALLSPTKSQKSVSVKSTSSKKSKRKNNTSTTKEKTKSKSKNQNSSLTDSRNGQDSLCINSNCDGLSNNDATGWTTWLLNATRRLAVMSSRNHITQTPSGQPILTTWASLDRLPKN